MYLLSMPSMPSAHTLQERLLSRIATAFSLEPSKTLLLTKQLEAETTNASTSFSHKSTVVKQSLLAHNYMGDLVPRFHDLILTLLASWSHSLFELGRVMMGH